MGSKIFIIAVNNEFKWKVFLEDTVFFIFGISAFRK